MSYVVLYPHSQTNSSDQFLVVDNNDWTKYVNGASRSVAVAGRFDNYSAASNHKDKLNNVEAPSVKL